MKIAIGVTPLSGTGGGERQALHLAIELEKRGHEVHLYTTAFDREGCFPDLSKHVDVRVVKPPLHHRAAGFTAAKLGRAVPTYWSLGRMFFGSVGAAAAKGDYDVVNFHNFSVHWGAPAAKRAGMATVWTANEPPFWYFMDTHRHARSWPIEAPFHHLYDKRAVRAIDEIVVLNGWGASLVRDIYGRDSTIVRCGVDSDRYQGAPTRDVRAELGIEGKYFVFIVASTSPYKFTEHALQALALLPEDAVLVLAGRGLGPMHGALAQRLGVAHRALFLDQVSEELITDLFRSCDVFLCPAQQTWGLVAAEAMSAGKPVIASERAGISEAIEESKGGFVHTHGDAAAIARHVRELMDDRAAAQAMGERARAYVRENLTWARNAEALERVFERAVARRRARR